MRSTIIHNNNNNNKLVRQVFTFALAAFSVELELEYIYSYNLAQKLGCTFFNQLVAPFDKEIP